MPERMGIDVGESVPLAKPAEPACHAVWVHGAAIVPAKNNVLPLETQQFTTAQARCQPDVVHLENA